MALKNVGLAGYREACSFAYSLNIPRNQHKRVDCPLCGGQHTFSVSNEGGTIKFHCFRASCGVSGYGENAQNSIVDIKHRLLVPDDSRGPHFGGDFNTNALIGNIPATWQPIEQYDKCWELLEKFNCLDVFESQPIKFMYDPAQDRLVFIEFNTSVTISMATGRSLSGDLPKWYKYVTKESIFSAYVPDFEKDPENKAYFICEDPPSACSLARFGFGLALCGTSWNVNDIVKYVDRTFSPVYICLDNDALKKSMALKRDLEPMLRREVRILQLSDDAKYMNYHQLKKEINNGKETPGF